MGWISVKDELPDGQCIALSMVKGPSYNEGGIDVLISIIYNNINEENGINLLKFA